MTRDLLAVSLILGMFASGAGAESAATRQFFPAGHSAPIKWSSWRPDGKQIATAAEDGQIVIWEAKTGQILQHLAQEKQGIGKPRWSGDGKRLMNSSLASYAACVWDVETGRPIHRLFARQEASGQGQLNASGALAVLPSNKGQFAVWDVNTGELNFIGSRSGILLYSLVLDAAEATGLSICSEKGEIFAQVFEAKTGKILHTLKEAMGRVNVIAITWDGTLGAIGFEDGRVSLWDLKTATKKYEWKDHARRVEQVSFSHDGSMLASADYSTTIVWETRTGEKLQTLSIEQSERGELDGAGHSLVTTGGRWPIIWDLKVGRVDRELKPAVTPVFGLAMDSQGKRLVSGSDDGAVVVWDMERGVPSKTWTAHAVGIRRVSCSADGQRLATGAASNSAALWHTETGELIREFSADYFGVKALSLNPAGTRLLINSGQDEALAIDCETGEKKPVGRGSFIHALGWSPAGDRILIGGTHDHRAAVVDAASGQIVREMFSRRASVFSGAISPDGKTLAAGYGGFSMGHAILWNIETGKPLRTLVGHQDEVVALSYRPQGEQLVTACVAGQARVWSLVDGKQLALLQGHAQAITSVVWHPQDRWIATSSLDGTIRLWAPKTGQELCRLVSVDHGKDWIVAAPDGRYHASPDALRKANLYQANQHFTTATPDLWQTLFPP